MDSDNYLTKSILISTKTRMRDDSAAAGYDQERRVANCAEETATAKNELQKLNKDFERYLETVRVLENQNRILLQEVMKARERATPKLVDKSQMDKQLEGIRNQLHSVSLQSAAHRADFEKNKDDSHRLTQQIKFHEGEIEQHRQLSQKLTNILNGFHNHKANLLGAIDSAKENLNKEKNKLQNAENQLDKLTHSLKDVRVQSKKLEFEIQTIEDELAFRKAVHEEEKKDVQNQLNASVMGKLDPNTFYKNEMQICLAKVREDFKKLSDKQLMNLKKVKELEYNRTVEIVTEERKRVERLAAANKDPQTVSELQIVFDRESKDYGQLKADNARLSKRLSDLEAKLADVKRRNTNNLEAKSSDADSLRAKNADLEMTNNDLSKLCHHTLEPEITCYRCILNCQLTSDTSNKIVVSKPVTPPPPTPASTLVMIAKAPSPPPPPPPVQKVEVPSSNIITTKITSQASISVTTNKEISATKTEIDTDGFLMQIFNRFDARGCGAIGSNEFDRILSSLNLQLSTEAYNELLREADPVSARKITFEEFRRIMLPVITGKFDNEAMLYSFIRFDPQGTGEITVSQLEQILSKVGQFYPPEHIALVINSAPIDANGKISYADYSKLMKRYF